MRFKRWWCFLTHWKRQQREETTHYYGWQCGICGERWLVQRMSGFDRSIAESVGIDPDTIADKRGMGE